MRSFTFTLATLAILALTLIALLQAASDGEEARRRRPKAKGQRAPAPAADVGPLGCAHNIFNLTINVSPDAYKKVPEVIVKYGYPVEKYRLTTKDGYGLTMFRIPHGKEGHDTKGPHNFPVAQAPPGSKPAVLLYHGMTGCSSSWILLPEKDSLAYMLANAGYDVWMTNARGTSYSQRHTSLNPARRRYWNWSFDEMAEFDIPVLVEKILQVTGEEKIYYVGHSMGGTVILMALSRFPELNSKFRSVHSFGPASYMWNVRMPFVLLAPLFPILDIATSFIDWGEVYPPLIMPIVKTLGPVFCAPSLLSATACGLFIHILGGPDPCQLNATESMSFMSGIGLDSISIRCLEHYIQLIFNKKFTGYDHGRSKNRVVYGTDTPYEYDVSKITAPMAVYWGQNDWLVSPESIAKLVSVLPNVIANHRVAFDTWSHFDFVTGMDARLLVYEPMMKLMAKHY